MIASSWLSNKWLRIVVLAVAAVVLLLMPSPLPSYLTTFDFQAYWGASRLLSQSDNFTDPALLLKLEQAATGFDQDTPLFAWNPPWFLAWFLPLAILGFERAVEDRLPRIQAAVITLLFVAANFLVLRQRSLQAPESEFFWLPLALALLCFWAWRLAYRSR